MNIPARILRAHVDRIDPKSAKLTEKQQEQKDRIMTVAQALFARHGRQMINITTLAPAVPVSAGVIRRIFCDLHALFGAILRRHLREIYAAVVAIPAEAPNCQQLRRAAYLAATRTPAGTYTEPHLLLVRDRHLLPDDELTPIDAGRHAVGVLLAGDYALLALGLLDLPRCNLTRLESMFGALADEPALKAPAPEPAIPAAPRAGIIEGPWTRPPHPRFSDDADHADGEDGDDQRGDDPYRPKFLC